MSPSHHDGARPVGRASHEPAKQRLMADSAESAGGKIKSLLRVNHAGEYGALRIYAGQLAFTRDPKTRALIRHMAAQEKEHLETFERLNRERGVRPTILLPLWHVAGYAMGAATALMGKEAAMACTVAVEEVIDGHYLGQEQRLPESEAALKETIAKFRADELEHRDTGLAQGAEKAPFYKALRGAVGGATRLAIWLSTRI